MPLSLNEALSKEQLTEIFIGPRSERFVSRWKSRRYYYCWPAFFFGMFWMLYRKMYLYSFILFSISILLILLAMIIGLNLKYFFLLNFIVSPLLGFCGSQMYRSFVDGKVKNYIQSQKYSVEMFRLYGGVTFAVPLTLLFLNCIAVLVMVLPEIDQQYFPKQKDADSLEWMILEEKH